MKKYVQKNVSDINPEKPVVISEFGADAFYGLQQFYKKRRKNKAYH